MSDACITFFLLFFLVSLSLVSFPPAFLPVDRPTLKPASQCPTTIMPVSLNPTADDPAHLAVRFRHALWIVDVMLEQTG